MPIRHTFLFNQHNLKSDGGTDGAVLLAVDTIAGTNRAPDETLEAFKAALVAWVNNSDDGRKAWGEYDCLNIGDIAGFGPPASLMDEMSKQKICGYHIRGIDFDLAVEHDTNLVPRKAVTRKKGDDE
jgi:hypothetical protein